MSEPTTSLTIEVPTGVDARLEKLAHETAQTKTWVAREALRAFLDLYDWQVQAIHKGMAAADAGRLADHKDVAAWLESWGTETELPPPSCD